MAAQTTSQSIKTTKRRRPDDIDISGAAHSSTTLGLTRFGYFGSTASVCLSQLRTVFRVQLDRPNAVFV
ncbi:hypothetical protein [Burkholderia sp. JP2-270]|uniref:hypothetical protein n=1 Tax=Burkholderia sp. JP2-270 TaxID=2217913 RepID=UPI0013A6E29E|nr:hypothetical protein [Burkholderia sp. JP2-270]